MDRKPFAIHSLGKSDLREAAKLCAAAMNDNPIHIKVFGAPPELRLRRLGRFFPSLIRYVHRKGQLHGAFVEGTLVGVMGMLPPKHCKPSLTDLLKMMPALLNSNNPAGTVRLAIWLGTWARLDPPTPHWHLGPLATAPAWQHQGIGSQLMELALKTGSGDAHYLETDKLSNVGFYERFGFSVLAQPSILATPSWVMMKPAFTHGETPEINAAYQA
ncbi:GNAT family N-acetyltransferase [Marinobacter salexigens]|uniref:GNAT family N-acetyltransferase n=1 Tax=Marinobacter salexigens TaxID=1925763 RepID=UPI000C285F84|nr:GNAT family N-acetyltransferase [Marinobacter salexigens]